LLVHAIRGTQSKAKMTPEPKDFEILPETLKNVRADRVSVIPPFRISGHLEQTNASLTSPFVGHVSILCVLACARG
jgi:hypothetical protein